MKITRKLGACIECGDFTNVTVSGGVYACASCLSRIGRETRNVQLHIDKIFSNIGINQEEKEMFIDIFVSILQSMDTNNINSVNNAIKTLQAVKTSEKYQNGTLDVKTAQKIEKMLDKYRNI